MAVKVLCVCLGNICRSPLAEAVLAHVAKERGVDVEVDSCGTAGYHVGEEPDERTVSTCKKHGVPIDHEARQIHKSDFSTFDYILASDKTNLANLERVKPTNATATVRLFGSYDDGKEIRDPYYGGMSGFEECYKQCVRYSNALLDEIEGKTGRTRSAM
ncbi:LMWPc-domain-containing protein [Exidia glandulosa HHB12029]|uniref:LMWPc-domain-containing protein n=1 Tax=Exidia glandulosa HHB12029 TaxID=1314781 RepID=A0A165PD23_EXIGL|nr:LMWPc-domain-containing protein [Exidia glandulosa HHB12029]